MLKAKQRPILFILCFFLICFIFRAIEYLFIRTDQSIIGEAFIHKLIGIALLAAAIWFIKYKWRDIGFHTDKIVRNLLIGLLLGGGVFVVGYGVEMIIQASAGNAPALSFYVTSYAVEGNRVMQGGLLLVFVCIVGNIINVVMEEGIFRGLFVRLTEEKYSFLLACLFSSLLFGIWHIAQPVRNVLDGVQSLPGASMMALMLVGTSLLGGIQYVLLYKVTGSLWAGMVAHFINNASANLLHVVTLSGADEMQTIRITIAQTLAFIIILIMFLIDRRAKKKAEATQGVLTGAASIDEPELA